MMVLAACGSVVNIPSALQQIQGVVDSFVCFQPRSRSILTLGSPRRFRFTDAFAFSEPGLDPHRITPFINEFAMNVLITGHDSAVALQPALNSSSSLQYTGIVHFNRTDAGVQVQRFERIHPTTRPNGLRFPQQCPTCRAYRPWVVTSKHSKTLNSDVAFRCGTKGCLGVFKPPQLKGYHPQAKDRAEIFLKILSL